jgi:hypothetical protein
MTFVDYWGVGATSGSSLPMTAGDISGHLVADWLPSLPSAVGTSLIGWPPFLIEPPSQIGNDLLTLHTDASRCERQWKSVFSWMLGVAGARHVLNDEGYIWIAPVSAFYANAIHDVDLSRWHPSFPRSVVTTSRPANSGVRLLPDYLALRPTRSGSTRAFDWAVVEAKGTRASLAGQSRCQPSWSNQARNVVVKVRGQELTIPRHMVIATRVNPNGVRRRTRRIQIRAWNNNAEPEEQRLSSAAAVEVVAAHLFGLFQGLRLPEYARAIAFSSWMRNRPREAHTSEAEWRQIKQGIEVAESELRTRARKPNAPSTAPVDAGLSVDTEFGQIEIDLSKPLMTLVKDICRSETSEVAEGVVQEADSQLYDWAAPRRAATQERDVVVLPVGVEVRLPPQFGHRR